MQTLFFLIIIGILSAVFGKGKASNNRQSRNKSFLPDNLKEFRTLFNKQLDNYSPGKTSPVIVKQKALDNLENKYLQIKEDSAIIPVELNNQQNTEQLQVKNKNNQIKDKVQVDEKAFSENANAKTLINGIVWAEILGEPRSKKPYHGRKS